MSTEAVELQLLACRSQKAMEAWVQANAGAALAGRMSRSAIDRLADDLKRNRRKEASAQGLALALVDGDALVAALRRGGILRASRYGFNARGLREFVDLLHRLREPLRLNEGRVRYLESLRSLYSLAAEARRMRDGLLGRLEARRGIALKAFLVMANQVFANGWRQDHRAPTHQLEHYSAEDISDAVSRLIALHREAFGLGLADVAYADAQALNRLNATYGDVLLQALRLEQLIRAEILIDGLPYQADVVNDDVVVQSIDPDLEKSVRLGYVQMELQVHGRRQTLEAFWEEQGAKPVSLEDLFKAYYEHGMESFAVFKPAPQPRIAFAIPAVPGFFDPLASDQYFREDLFFLLQLGVDNYADLSLEPFEVVQGLRSIDLFKVNRLFALMSYVMARELAKATDTSRQEMLTLNSVIPIVRREHLLALLGVVLGPERAERVLSLLTLDGTRDYVDLQYTPFISIEGSIVFAPALVAHSNLVRNLVCANQLHEGRLADDDPMQQAVADALREAGFRVGVEVSIKGAESDTDIVAYRDGALYLFECKNAYHPCNPHEMRNSYDHIQKAGRQLTLRQTLFSEPANQAKLWKKLGWDMPAPTQVRTGVLIANRVFTGMTIAGHPVRQAHEFINVLLRGEIRAPDATYCFWIGDSLTTADVDSYLGGDGLLRDHFTALKPIRHKYEIGAKSLAFDSWYFDIEHQQRIVGERYRLKSTPAD